MRALLWGCALWLGICNAGWASELNLKEGYPERYTVVSGDTLWDIARRYLDDPWLWPQLWHENPQIENPDRIYPGDVLQLIYLDGQPRLTLAQRTIKLQPEIRVLPSRSPVPAISRDVIDSFLTRSRIVSPRQLESAPYVIGGAEQRIINGAGDRIYARGQGSQGIERYGVYRPGRLYRDPDSGEVLGLEALEIGMAELEQQHGELLTLRLNRSRQETRIEDRLLPQIASGRPMNYFPATPEQPVSGRIIAVLEGVRQAGQFDVVALNCGRRDGLAAGHVLAVYQRGERIRDQVTGEWLQLPAERAGVLMVFRSFDKMSYAVVLRATRAMAVMDKVQNP